MKQFEGFKARIKTMGSTVHSKSSATIVKLCLILFMVKLCSGEARQYGESENGLFTRPEGRENRRNSGIMKLLTPDENSIYFT